MSPSSCPDERAYHFYRLGVLELEDNHIESAICYFLQSAQAEDHFKTYEQLCVCYIKQGKKELAFESIQKAYSLNPQSDKTAYMYACMLRDRGNVVLSKNVAREIMERNSSYRSREIQELLSQ